MVGKDDKTLPTETDATITLLQLQRFINRVAGHIRRRLPGVELHWLAGMLCRAQVLAIVG